jgi:LacI family transcriptional regulator
MPRKDTLTRSLADRLRSEIRSRKWKADQPLPSERELAAQYKLSRVTARRCLKQLCDEQVLVARPGLGYFPVMGAMRPEELRQRRSVLYYYVDGNGGLALDAVHARIVNGANAEAIRAGMDLYAVSRPPADFQRTLGTQWRGGLRGVLLDWARPELAEHMLRANIPFVVVEDDIEGLPITAVIQDNGVGTIQALEHLAARGHRRLGLIVNEGDSIHPRQRLAAYREFLLRSGLPANPDWIGRVQAGESSAKATAAILDGAERPTALLVANRGLLDGVMEELARRGLRCPEDLSIVTWGSPASEWRAAIKVDVTYVAWSPEEMGCLAMRALEDRVRAGRPERMVIRIAAHLVDRGSVAAVPPEMRQDSGGTVRASVSG